MLLVLVSASILNHTTTVDVPANKTLATDEMTPVVIKAVLGYSHQQEINKITAYTMFDDNYWFRANVTNSIVMNFFEYIKCSN